jgi:hypothetical protein
VTLRYIAAAPPAAVRCGNTCVLGEWRCRVQFCCFGVAHRGMDQTPPLEPAQADGPRIGEEHIGVERGVRAGRADVHETGREGKGGRG